MALPQATEARPFYQSAKQRLQDAQYLFQGGRTTAAVYLAGYAIECMLKALILSVAERSKRADIVASFRGSKAHDFRWLQSAYARHGGPPLPGTMTRRFRFAETWDTSLRYQPRTIKQRNAALFLQTTEEILRWADGRL